jgi:hypothetical protein
MKALVRQNRLKAGLRAFGVPALAGLSAVLEVKSVFMNWALVTSDLLAIVENFIACKFAPSLYAA